MTEPHAWPDHLAGVGAVRFARPTAHFDDALAFYRDALGLPVLAEWRADPGDPGYDGVVLGLPGTPVHLELTQHGDPPQIPPPDPENLVVLYLPGPDAVARAVDHLARAGHQPVAAANSYWPQHGCVVFMDPDGWHVVLAPWVFGEEPPPRVDTA